LKCPNLPYKIIDENMFVEYIKNGNLKVFNKKDESDSISVIYDKNLRFDFFNFSTEGESPYLW
jgi:hypothetical protein